jgi:hypothetical protein
MLTYSLDYGGSVRIPTTPTDFSDGLNPLCDLPSCPFRAGYNGISFASDLRNMDVDICRSLKRVNANLVLTLKNTDPFLATVSSTDGNLDESSVEESSIDNPPTPTDDSEFIIHVRGLVVRELLFKNNRCYVVSESKNQVNN